jgi:DNA-3-methyladenine glycosylase I
MVKVTYDPQDNKKRCAWCLKDAQYVDYHDTEWGIPSHDDHHLFEHLILETFQAGLSWHTILKKREAFRLAFDNFSANKMASYHENEIEILVHNAAIIRHRGKIEAAIHNAKQFLRLQKQYGSFNHYIWQFTNYETIVIPIKTCFDWNYDGFIVGKLPNIMVKRTVLFLQTQKLLRIMYSCFYLSSMSNNSSIMH